MEYSEKDQKEIKKLSIKVDKKLNTWRKAHDNWKDAQAKVAELWTIQHKKMREAREMRKKLIKFAPLSIGQKVYYSICTSGMFSGKPIFEEVEVFISDIRVEDYGSKLTFQYKLNKVKKNGEMSTRKASDNYVNFEELILTHEEI